MGHNFSALKSIEHWAKLSNCEKYQTQFDTAFGNKIYEFSKLSKITKYNSFGSTKIRSLYSTKYRGISSSLF